jgi:plastocyanin
VGDPLPNPLVVRVRNAGSQDLNNVTVQWTVTQGAGALGTPTSNTNVQGQASNTLTVGAGAGAQTVTAAVQSNTSLNVTFTATANAITTTAGVTVSNNQFSPFNGKVLATGTVTWTWAPGAVTHNVTWVAGGFTNSGDKSTGTHQVTFPAAGTYSYYCSIHGTPGGGMNGTVTVSN